MMGPDPDLPVIAARLHGIKLRLLILSGKGGVGKSTITKELALALGRRGLEVGVLDADICGPSQPRMLGVRSEEIHHNASGITPVSVREGVSMMSIHFLMADDQKNDAITWRGPQKNGTIKSFMKEVNWQSMSGSDRPLDCLLVDTPPGTTDEHITLANLLIGIQKIEDENENNDQETKTKTCAIVVTTPQEVAVNDVRRELTFCNKAKVPILGLVVNMDGFVCPCCKKMSQIFPNETTQTKAVGKKRNAADALAEEFGIPILGRIPLDPDVMLACEAGVALCEHEDLKVQQESSTSPSRNDQNNTNTSEDEAAHEKKPDDEDSPAVIAVEDMVDKIMDLCDL
jgi:Mrp family chromosome partitioning ATPase